LSPCGLVTWCAISRAPRRPDGARALEPVPRFARAHGGVDGRADVPTPDVLGDRRAAAVQAGEHRLLVERRRVHLAAERDAVLLLERGLDRPAVDSWVEHGEVLVVVRL